MPKLLLLVGPPGSGKSSLAKKYQANNWIRINQDEDGKQHLEIFKEAIQKRYDIVIDRLNFVKIQRDRYLNPAKEAGYETEIRVLHVPKETCFRRCADRKDHPTIKNETDASQAINMFFGKYERVQDSEADVVTRLGWAQEFNPIIICDLDGTLCNTDHRQHFMEGKKNWPGFFGAMSEDTLNQPVNTTLLSLYPLPIYFASGRPDNYKEQTKTWLEKHTRVPYEGLYMRPRNDSRRDDIVKEIILDFELLTRGTPFIILDDRDQVVTMWRKRGYTCFQVAPGAF